MIFPNLVLEPVVQVSDKTRLDGRKSFITSDEAAITLVEIEPSSGAGFIDVTSKKYLDWEYSTDATETVSIRVTTDGAPVTVTKDLVIISETDDNLFSNDSDLIKHEPDLLNYVPQGRNSYLDMHRRAQDRIVNWLSEQRLFDDSGERLTKAAIVDVDEVREWSTFMVMRFIMEGLSNATDDIFAEKAHRYERLEVRARKNASLKLDFSGNGELESDERIDVRSKVLLRR